MVVGAIKENEEEEEEEGGYVLCADSHTEQVQRAIRSLVIITARYYYYFVYCDLTKLLFFFCLHVCCRGIKGVEEKSATSSDQHHYRCASLVNVKRDLVPYVPCCCLFCVLTFSIHLYSILTCGLRTIR